TALQQEGANLIDDTRTLADQPLPYPMQRLQVELIGGFRRAKLHRRTLHCFRYRLGIAEVILAKRASTWPRDHFWHSTIAPRSSWPTVWNEFLPISMPTAVIEVWGV